MMTRKLTAKWAGAVAATGIAMGVFSTTPLLSHAAEAPASAEYYAPPSVQLNGQPLATSVAPLVRNGRTLVPMRDIFEALGATVVWNGESREIRAQRDTTQVWLQIGNYTARVDQNARTLDEAPMLYGGSTLVPLRFVSEALGASVNWNGATRIVAIQSGERLATNPETPKTAVHGTITIPDGAVVPVMLDSTLTSAEARVGDTFTATVKSEKPGDSEFPPGTQLRGRITEVQRLAKDNPGVLGLEFTQAILLDGTTIPIKGELISLNSDSVTQNNGRIMAKDNDDNSTVKAVGIGAAAGFVLGKVLGKSSLITGIIGAAGGYLYDRKTNKDKAREAVIASGSTLGVRLTSPATYTDTSDYAQRRSLFLR
jgi:hypothetical protein